MSDINDTKPKADDKPEAEQESPWVAAVPLRWGLTDTGEPRWINPGQPVPADESGRNYELLKRTGQIIHKDGAAGIAPYTGASFVLLDSENHLAAPVAPGEIVAVDLGNGADGAGSGEGVTPAAGPAPQRYTMTEAMTLSELGAIAESLGLPTSGSKAQIIARVNKAQDAAEAAHLAANQPAQEGAGAEAAAGGSTPPADAAVPAGEPSSDGNDPTKTGTEGA